MQTLEIRDVALEERVRRFLYREAELLDDRQLKQWLVDCVDQDLHYVIPLRTTLLKEEGTGFSTTAHLQDDDFNAMTMRINRFDSKAAWSENPPTRVRHYVTNIRVGNTTAAPEEEGNFTVEVKSNVLIYRTRTESADHDLLSAERRDVLSSRDGTLRLLRREVLPDFATVGTHNFSFIF